MVENKPTTFKWHRKEYSIPIFDENTPVGKFNSLTFKKYPGLVVKTLCGEITSKPRVMTGSHTKEQWEAKKAQYSYRCAYCNEKPKYLTRDHVIPIYSGGSDNISNIVPCCWKCNRKKNTRPLEKFKEGTTLKLV